MNVYSDLNNPGPDELFVPHSLALLEQDDTICVADREHYRYWSERT